MTKIPFSDAIVLVRDLGLLVNQVAIYGITHKVIQQQAIDFFNRLKPLAEAHGTVEFSLQGDKLAVNGEPDGIDMMSSRNLKEKMLLHKLPGLIFSKEIMQDEFMTLLSCLGKPPGKVQEMGGFEEVLKTSGMKGVSLLHFVYERVDTKNASNEPAPVKRPKRVRKPKTEGLEEGLADQSAVDPATHAPTQARIRRKRVQTELGSLFAEVTQLVSEKQDPQSEKMVEALRSIRDTLQSSTEPAKERIASLLGHEEELPPGVPGARPKRKKRKPPKFSHAEYMNRFAELTQEIAQPLTVTNSVIEVLRQGQIGSLNETQTQFLDLALESVDRVNQLIKYMHTLFGEPASFTPNAAIINETYV